MTAWTGLRLVGGVRDSDFMPEPPAPLPFAAYAAELRHSSAHPRLDVDDDGEAPAAYDGLISLIDRIGGDITSLAHALGLDMNHDTDRPRAA